MIPLGTESLYPHQRAWLEARGFWSAMVGPYGCGKTGAGILWAMDKSLRNPGRRGLWIEPTFGMIKDILLPELEAYLDSIGLVECVNTKRALRWDEYLLTRSGRPELALPFHTWMLRSGEIPSRLKGPTVAWALLDEADLMNLEVEEVALSRVRDPQADALAIGHVGTPESFGSWLHERVEGNKRQAEDVIVRARREDVKGLPERYYERMREAYDPLAFQQYAEGRWVLRTEGLIYTPPFSGENLKPCPYRPGWPVFIGMDFNVNPFSFVCTHEVDGRVEAFRQYRIPGANSQSVADLVKTEFSQSPVELWVDATGNQHKTCGVAGSDVEILRGAGLDVHFTQIIRVNDRYNATRAMLCNAAGKRRLFVDPEACRQLVRELQTLTYEKAAKPNADNHTTSALDYLMLGRHNPVWSDEN